MSEAIEPEVLSGESEESDKTFSNDSVEQPAKVMRVGTMMRQLLEEVKASPLDEASRERLREIYQSSIAELASALSEELQEELVRLSSPFNESDSPSNDELRIAQAQLVGWLEGLIQGIQAALFAQQFLENNQTLDSRPGILNAGNLETSDSTEERPGNYL